MRSLMVQALHPLAMAGVAQHSNWRQDPFGRLAATSSYLLTTTYGDTASALAAAAWVRKVHVHVRGIDPETSLPYSAAEPALLPWVPAGVLDWVGLRLRATESAPPPPRCGSPESAAAPLWRDSRSASAAATSPARRSSCSPRSSIERSCAMTWPTAPPTRWRRSWAR